MTPKQTQVLVVIRRGNELIYIHDRALAELAVRPQEVTPIAGCGHGLCYAHGHAGQDQDQSEVR